MKQEMKQDILTKIAAVLNALENVSVKGKQNLGNLSGSIAVLEEVCQALNTVPVEKTDLGSEKQGDV